MPLSTSIRFPAISFSAFVVGFALFNLLAYHFPLLNYTFTHLSLDRGADFMTLATVIIAQFLITAFLFTLFGLIHTKVAKFLAVLFLLTNSIALYFTQSYHVILTKAMMGNAFNTNQAEALELISPSILLYLLLLGILPAWVVLKVAIRPISFAKKLIPLTGSLVILLAWGLLNSSSWLWLDKHAKNLGGLSMPWSYLINGISYKIRTRTPAPQKLLPPLSFKNPDHKEVIVLVIGEAARSDHFSLYGYPKATNPLLEKREISVMPNPTSCATYTTASVACILSHQGSKTGILSNNEPLPSYLQRFGVDVIWRTKNWGEPQLKVKFYQRDGEIQKLDNSSCENPDQDEILLCHLEKSIKQSSASKIFVVLHQSGSHGPAYHKKYPASFEHFTPVCTSVQLGDCTSEALHNAYDNTILYTDYLLDKLIKQLESLSMPAAMLYISDHGESLGEEGFYLHGAPKAIAPKAQSSIPFLAWMNEEFRDYRGLTHQGIIKESSYSQDYIFHSVLGAFEATSEIYDERFDLFK